MAAERHPLEDTVHGRPAGGRGQAADPLVGTLLGAVRLTSVLARGTMGRLYRGHHTTLGRDVAVKIVMPGSRPNALARFLRECRHAARIQHPHVVRSIEAHATDAGAYLVLELVEGENLLQAIERRGRLPSAEVARLAAQAAAGLAAIHAHGLVHRDLKPENLLLDRAGVLKIADLGLSAMATELSNERLTRAGCLVGTPLYLAPEYIRDSAHSPPSCDIYALGATLYHALAGVPPFHEERSLYHLMQAHLERTPPPLTADVELRLAGTVLACLAKDPAHRPSLAALQALAPPG